MLRSRLALVVGLAACVTVFLVCLLASVRFGAARIGTWDVISAFTDYGGSEDDLIIRTLRVPRALVAALVGAALAVAGAIIQGLTRNPLADPWILGIEAGAAFAVVCSVFLLGASSLTTYALFAFLGGALAAGGGYSFWERRGEVPVEVGVCGGGGHYPGVDAQPARGPLDTRDRGRGRVRGRLLRVFAGGLVAHHLRPVRVSRRGHRGGGRLLFRDARRHVPDEAGSCGGGAGHALKLAQDGHPHPQPADARGDPVLARRLGGRQGPVSAAAGAALRRGGAAVGVRAGAPDHGPHSGRRRGDRARAAHGVAEGSLRRRGGAPGRQRRRHSRPHRLRGARDPARRPLSRRGGLPLGAPVLRPARVCASRLAIGRAHV